MESTNANPLDNAVCFVLKISALGNSRKVPTSAVVVDADSDMVGVNKKLFKSEEYKAVKRYHQEIRQFVYSRSVPAFFVRDGVYMIKASNAESLIRDVDRMIVEANRLADVFSAVYPELVNNVPAKLRSLFNPRDYMTATEARNAFSITYQFVEFGPPGRLRSVSPETFAAESQKLRETFTNAAESITQLLYAETAKLMDHAIERLSGNGDKPKIFRDSLVENLKEFFQGLKDRNLTDNAELNAIADRCNALLSNVAPEFLRNSSLLRERVTAAFTEVKTQVDAAMVDRPSRMIELD